MQRSRQFRVLITLFISSFLMTTQAQVIINEVLPGGTVELKNIGQSTIDVSGYILCEFPTYNAISNLTILSGSTSMAPGDILAVDGWSPAMDPMDGEMGLYINNNFGSANSIVSYVEWGSTGHRRSSVATSAGIWPVGDFVPSFQNGESIIFDETSLSAAAWSATSSPSIGQENTGNCTVDGGVLTGGPFEFCVDGEADFVSGITLDSTSGDNTAWVITDDQGNILGLPPMPGVVDFDEAGAGICLIWNISFADGLEGLAAGNNVDDLDGCFDLSNSITVVRNQPNGGVLTGGPFEFCVDGEADFVSGITLDSTSGDNTAWVITDDQGNILGLPPMPGVVDFDEAGAGICLIWNISFADGLDGLAAGNNVADLDGCFALSNSITVVRNEPNGGVLTGGPFEFVEGDGIADLLADSLVTVTNSNGENFQWVITDDEGYILGLPPTLDVVDVEGAGPGNCLIWHLAYTGDLIGAAPGANAADLEGCFSLSNPIEIIRTNVDGCDANGGNLFGGPFEFVEGDGIADLLADSLVTVTNSNGENFQWVITDDEGYILGLPPTLDVVDVEGAGPGNCLIWHLAYTGDLIGAAPGANAADLEGCFSLSNPIEVIRTNVDSCDANGGTLFGGPFEFVEGDGIADLLADSLVTVVNSNGENFQWVITDDEGYILGLPPTLDVVDVEGAGPGNCLIWHLAYTGDLIGAAPGANAADLEGCFSLSNSIEVIRTNVDSCNANGGTLFGGPFEFCVGDGSPDLIAAEQITLANSQGTVSQWVITDDQGMILGLPPSFDVVDFDDVFPGTCLVYHVSHDGQIAGLAAGNNISDLTGCLDISNSIAVLRNQPDGGVLTGGPFEFCVDGEADFVSGITLDSTRGDSTAWVITDDQGNILGLPPMPGVVDFDEAGAGICLIWNISFADGLEGLAAGNNVADLEGCFDLSNSITVVRNQPDGGVLTGGPFEFCVDGEADFVSGITLDSISGDSTAWVITDDQGNILGLPPMPGVVDFDEAGAGICLIWNISFADGLEGLAAGNNVADLEGCFALSNSITVTRLESGGPCTTSTAEIDELRANLSVYPNPASDILMVDLGTTSTVTRGQLLDFTGGMIYQFDINDGKASIDVSQYTAGAYVLQVLAERPISKRIVLSH